MFKKIMAALLCLAILVSGCPTGAFAAENATEATGEESGMPFTLGQVGGYLAGNIETVKHLYADRRFTDPQGHGFAAERGNNLIAVLSGQHSTVIGESNVKNGPDRVIIRRRGNILIQDKYYSTAGRSVSAAFDEKTGMYRYLDGDGVPMKLEVPADQYDDAVVLMRKKIEQGLVPGVSDPDEAESIVRRGSLSYQQAVNLTKAGTLESLKYDAVNGVVTAGCAAGIGFAIDYACCMLNGMDAEAALANASRNGLKTGGVVFATYVISSQLARTGVANALAPTAEAIAKALGDDVCEAILLRSGINTAGMSSARLTANVAKILSRELIADGVLIVVLTGIDVVELFNGRISKEQLLKNLTVTIISIAAGTAGGVGGAALGSLIAPGAGTYIGAIVGSTVAGGAGGYISEAILSQYYESDAEQMFKIISDEFLGFCQEYLISEEEGGRLAQTLSALLTGDLLKDMYASEDRTAFARDLLEPLFAETAAARPEIDLPTESQMRQELKSSLEGIVFVH